MDQNPEKTDIERPLGPPAKLTGYDFYRKTLNSPKFLVAPMVDQSELPWRILSRRYGAELCYTPMIHSRVFLEVLNESKGHFGGLMDQYQFCHPSDRPLIAQFCGNDPNTLSQAVLTFLRHVDFVDAIDLNLGCPQGIAKRGFYGAFLMDDLRLVENLVSTLDRNVQIPITAKIRVFESTEKTLAYAKMLVNAGAQMLTVHGRKREMKGCLTALADWDIIKAVKEAVNVPVFANGNILYYEDCIRCMEFTGCDGIMSAEGNLWNPALFSLNMWEKPDYSKFVSSKEFLDIASDFDNFPLLKEHPPAHILALEYLDICRDLVNNCEIPMKSIKMSAIKGHLFKMLRFVLEIYPEYRPRIGSSTSSAKVYDVIADLGAKVEKHVLDTVHSDDSGTWSLSWLSSSGAQIRNETLDGVEVTGHNYHILPFWVAQPYIRPPVSEENCPPAMRTEVAQNIEKSCVIETASEAEKNLAAKLEDVKEQTTLIRQQRAKRKHEQAEKYWAKKATSVKCKSCNNQCSSACPNGRCKSCCRTYFSDIVRQALAQKGVAMNKLNPEMMKHCDESAYSDSICKAHCARSWGIEFKD